MNGIRSPACVARLVWRGAVFGPGELEGNYTPGTFLAYATTSNWTYVNGRFVGVQLDENMEFLSSKAFNDHYGDGKLETIFSSATRACKLEDATAWQTVVRNDAAEAHAEQVRLLVERVYLPPETLVKLLLFVVVISYLYVSRHMRRRSASVLV